MVIVVSGNVLAAVWGQAIASTSASTSVIVYWKPISEILNQNIFFLLQKRYMKILSEKFGPFYSCLNVLMIY